MLDLILIFRCINSIRDMQQNTNCCNAPFRESKLTQLFQKALQGKEDILMIVSLVVFRVPNSLKFKFEYYFFKGKY